MNNNEPTSPQTPEMSPTPSPSPSPLPQATNLEQVATNLERILERTKSSPTKEVDGFVLVKKDAGLLEAAVAEIRAFKQQSQPQQQEKPSLLSRLSFGFFKGGKKTRKNRDKNKTRRNKNKTRRNKSVHKQKKHRK